MKDDLRQQLQDLSSEMPPLFAPSDLRTRVRRRELRTASASLVVVIVVSLAAVVGGRAVLRSQEPTPAIKPAPFPSADAAVIASETNLQAPEGLVFDADGNLYVSEYYGNRVDRIDPSGSFSVIAGTGTSGFSGDTGAAVSTELASPTALAFAKDGTLRVVDNGNNCVRAVGREGQISTVAGTCGTEGSSGDDGPALEARMSRPLGLAIAPDGSLFISDNDYGLGSARRHPRHDHNCSRRRHSLLRIDAGKRCSRGFALFLGRTSYVLLDGDGNLYVSDLELNVVVKIDPRFVATVVAGTGSAGFSGDGGPANRARPNFPSGLAMDDRGNLYISDTNNNRIRMVNRDGIITTVVGKGEAGDSGDGGPAIDALLHAPAGLAFDAQGSLYIADQLNDRVRRLDASGVITTIVGVG